MVNEFFGQFGKDVAISMTPGANGRLEVYVEGEKIFDRHEEEDNKMPDLKQVREMKAAIQEKVDAAPTPVA